LLSSDAFGIAKLLYKGKPNGGFGGYGWRDFQNGDAALGLLRIAGIVRPCIDMCRSGMMVKFKNFDDSFPDHLAMKSLRNRHAPDMGGVHSVQTVDDLLQIFQICRHWGASLRGSTRSA
jgi:hypothetical protein